MFIRMGLMSSRELSESCTLPDSTHISNIVALARIISSETEKLDNYLSLSKTPYPSFDCHGLADFPKLPEHMQKTRQEIIRATSELRDLTVGPTETLRWMWDGSINTLSLQSILHYGIHKAFPIGTTTTFGELFYTLSASPTSTTLTLQNLRRLIRHAITNRIFCEPEPGIIAHTSFSAALLTNQPLQDWLAFCCDDLAPAAGKAVASMDLFPGSGEPAEAGFCVAEGTAGVEPMFVTMGRNAERSRRFGQAMLSLTGGEGYEIHHLLTAYPWSEIDSLASPLLVDIGGSHGFVCTALASHYSNINFIVQDLPKMIASAPDLSAVPDTVIMNPQNHDQDPTPEQAQKQKQNTNGQTLDSSLRPQQQRKPVNTGILSDRIHFMSHDFHTPQPIQNADIYFFRWILHNLSDKYAIAVLRNLIPALKVGARVVVNDHCLREPGEESLWDDKIMRTMDLAMLSLLNATERSASEFEALFTTASPGFRFLGVTRPAGCRMSVVVAVWVGLDDGDNGDGEKWEGNGDNGDGGKWDGNGDRGGGGGINGDGGKLGGCEWGYK